MVKNKLFYVGILAIVVVGVFIFASSLHSVTSKCPGDYGTDDAGSAEYLAAWDKWTNNFFDTHPGATLSDWSEARYQFWVENDCVELLQKYKEVQEGRADPETMEQIKQVRDVIQKEVDSYR